MLDQKEIIKELIADAFTERFGNAGGTAEDLRTLGESYLTQHDFRPGDLIMWKPGLRNARLPFYGNPAIVLEICPGQRSFSGKFENQRDGELCDLRFGIIVDGDLVAFWHDSNRFQPYWPPTEEMKSA